MAAPTATTSSGFTPCGLPCRDFLNELLHARHPRHTADEDDFVDVGRFITGVLESGQHRRLATIDQRRGDLFKLRPRDVDLQVLRPEASAVMNGSLIVALVCCDKSFLVCSQASFRR